MRNLKLLLGPMRVPFLILSPACVTLGLATAAWSGRPLSLSYVLLVFIGALAGHVAVNMFNEYFDFRSGLDSQTERTPFSGGSGTLPGQPQLARPTLLTAWAAFGVTALVGTYFVLVRGFALLPLGLLGLVLLYAYTTWIAYHPFLCLVAPGLGFGPLMVMGTHFVLTGEYSWTALIASLVPFFLVSGLLLLNQFPDLEADRHVGRRHFPIVAGRKISSVIYGSLLVHAYLVILIGVHKGCLPPASLAGLLTAAFAVPASVGAFRYADQPKQLVPFMGLNVLITLATPVLVAIGLFVG